MKQICLCLLIAFALPVWSQVEPSATGGETTQEDDVQMLMPPPVSVVAYPTEVGSETRANYLSGGMIFTAGYDDNVAPGYAPVPVSDFTYFIWPTISIKKKTVRQNLSLTYSPGFQFYQSTSALNAVDQNADAGFQYRLSPHATITAHDYFQQNSTVFDQPFAVSGVVSGSSQAATTFIIAPYADQLSNSARAEISYQFGLNGMIGGGATTSLLDYSNISQVPGLYNFMSGGAMGFYNRRITNSQYIGAIYQYSRIVTEPISSTTQTHLLSLFYTLYWHRTLTFSLAAGPQYYDFIQSGVVPSSAWSPAVTASIGWQTSHTNFAASYSRTISAGGGLLGAYNSDNANADARWQVAPPWTVDVQGSYARAKNATPLSSFSYPGGHTVTVNASLQRRINERLRVDLGYARLHQRYSGVSLINNAPDSNREFISVAYQFTRSLGR
jgi:hypothetical protein